MKKSRVASLMLLRKLLLNRMELVVNVQTGDPCEQRWFSMGRDGERDK